MKPIRYKPIGVIRSPFRDPKDMPIQPISATGIRGSVILEPEFQEGLQDLEGFSHVILLYHFHLSRGYSLKVTPFMDTTPHGLFATRAPRRPNPIGISTVVLERIEGRILHIINIDVVDGTPLLDIKPYVPDFDAGKEVKIGWLTNNIVQARKFKSDDRFSLL